MYTYKLAFNTGKKMKTTTENLDQAYIKIINYMEANDLTECVIVCPNKKIRRVRKTDDWHPIHNGYSFD